MIAPLFIKIPAGVHPDHGEPVDYSAGQLLPEWLAEQIESGAIVLQQLDKEGRLTGEAVEYVKADGSFRPKTKARKPAPAKSAGNGDGGKW